MSSRVLLLLVLSPLLSLVAGFVLVVLAAWAVGRTRVPCPACLYEHPSWAPCLGQHPRESGRMTREQIIEMERREQIADDRFLHGDRR